MPGRTLATWYGRSKLQYSTEEAGSEGSGGEPSDSTFHPSAPPFYSRSPQPGGQYEQPPQQYDANYGYYPNVNQSTGNSGNTTNYPDQRNYSPNYTPQSSQYTPQSPASPSYYSSQSQQVQLPHHEMSYPNSQGAYNQSPSHYGSPNHQNSNYPTGGNPWSPQQSAADYTHHASPSPQQQVMAGSPVATPSPAHTPSSTGPINSPPPAMPGQYPAHHHARHPPMGSSPPAPGHGHPAWNHPSQQGLPIHPGQPAGYYPPPHVPLVGPGRGGLPPGPPQHAHMASDRHSPHHSANPAAWNSVPIPKTTDGRLPPPTSHPQNNGGPGNPLFNLQLLVNQDMNRAAQVNAYRGAPPSALPETVDLSATGPTDVPQTAPIPLTRNNTATPEHSSASLRNGGVQPSSTVAGFNGDLSSDSGLSSSTSTPGGGVIAENPLAGKTADVDVRGKDSVDVVQLRATTERVASPAADVPVVSSSKSEENTVEEKPTTISPVRSPKNSAGMKRTKKVDLLLETLVESGTIKLTGGEQATPVVTSVIVSREPPPPSPSPPTPRDPDESVEPRRKRKPDKPTRVSKTDSEPLVKTEGVRTEGVRAEGVRAEGVRTEGVRTKAEIKEMPEVTSTNTIVRGPEPERTRRRSSSECSEPSSRPTPTPVARARRRSESDQADAHRTPPDAKNAFIEVESELEKMFAGIEEGGGVLPLKPAGGVLTPVKATPALTPVDGVPKGGRRGRPKGSKSSESPGEASSSAEHSRKKKKKQARKRCSEEAATPVTKKRPRGTKLYAADSVGGSRDIDSGSNASNGRPRGPVLHIEGPKENPYSVTVVNAPALDDEGEKPKKPPTGRRKNTYHSDLDYRGKVCPTVFSSTLSAKYDANTPDPTWMCVFCKCRPHSNIGGTCSPNGDLFGPYFVTRDKTEAGRCAEVSSDDRDINEEQKKGGRNKTSIRKSETVEQFRQKMSKKARRSQSFENAPVYGMLAVPEAPETKGETFYEVWFHEDCFVWASGTRIVGSHLYGLQDAVWNAVPIVCNKCGLGGAVIGCVARNCQWRLHYHCAQELGWDLDPDTFVARCKQHRIKQEAGPSATSSLSR